MVGVASSVVDMLEALGEVRQYGVHWIGGMLVPRT
jgi:hypothetical protein